MAIFELILTESQRGLFGASPGFQAVAATKGIPVELVKPLTDLAQRMKSRATSEAEFLAHVVIQHAGSPYHLLTRGVVTSSSDSAGRRGWLVHQIVITTVNQLSSGPAWMLLHGCNWINEWTREPQFLGELRLEAESLSPRVCAAWKQQYGDAGWGGTPWEAWQKSLSFATTILGNSTKLSEALELFIDSQSLVEPKYRWNVPIFVGFSLPSPRIKSAWAIWRQNSDEALEASRQEHWIVFSGNKRGETSNSGLSSKARTGDWINLSPATSPAPALDGKPERSTTPPIDPFLELTNLALQNAPIAPRQSALVAKSSATRQQNALGRRSWQLSRTNQLGVWLGVSVLGLLLLAGITYAAISVIHRGSTASTTAQQPAPSLDGGTSNTDSMSSIGRGETAASSSPPAANAGAPVLTGNEPLVSTDGRDQSDIESRANEPINASANSDSPIAAKPPVATNKATSDSNSSKSTNSLEEIESQRIARAEREISKWLGPQAVLQPVFSTESNRLSLLKFEIDESAIYALSLGLATKHAYLAASPVNDDQPHEIHWLVDWPATDNDNVNAAESKQLRFVALRQEESVWELNLEFPADRRKEMESLLAQSALSIWYAGRPESTALIPFTLEYDAPTSEIADAIRDTVKFEISIDPELFRRGDQDRIRLQADVVVPTSEDSNANNDKQEDEEKVWLPPHSSKNATNLFVVDPNRWTELITQRHGENSVKESLWGQRLQELLDESKLEVEIRVNEPEYVVAPPHFQASVHATIFLKIAGDPSQSLVLQNQSRETKSLRKSEFETMLRERVAEWLSRICDCGLTPNEIVKGKALSQKSLNQFSADQRDEKMARSLLVCEVFRAIDSLLAEKVQLELNKKIRVKDHHGFKDLEVKSTRAALKS
jgi:hypothetical protein